MTWLLALLLSTAPHAETGFFPVAQSSVEARVLVDAQVEEPALYSMTPFVPTPPAGAAVPFQVFMPEIAGRRAYGLAIAFLDSSGTFLDRFEITDASTDLRPPMAAATDSDPAYQSLALTAPLGSKGPLRSVLFLSPWTLSSSGLLAVLTLQAKRPVDTDEPLILEARVNVEADTPPTRLIQYRGYTHIIWR